MYQLNFKTMSAEKMYIKPVKEMMFGKETLVKRSLLHYTKGVIESYWTDMTKGQFVDKEGNRLKDSHERVLIPIGWVTMNGVFFPSFLEDKDSKTVTNEEGKPYYKADSFREKGILTVYGFWSDSKDGKVKWDSFRNLISVDFKTWSASNLLNQMKSATMGIDKDGNSVSLSMLRIKLGDLKPTTHPKAMQFTFDVKVDRNLEFDYIVSQWLEDLEFDIYNQEHLTRLMEHNDSLKKYFSSHNKFAPIELVKEFMPLQINKVLNEENGGLLIESGGVRSNVMAIAQKSEVEEEVDADFFE